MPATINGLPYWELGFDQDGRLVAPGGLFDELPAQGVTDLFVLTHGWNNDLGIARRLYQGFFTQLGDTLARTSALQRPGARVGVVGVIWPSMRWADESLPGVAEGAVAGLAAEPSDGQLVEELRPQFPGGEQGKTLDELADLLDRQPEDDAELARFHELVKQLVGARDLGAPEDQGEATLFEVDNPEELYEQFATLAPAPASEGGTMGLGDRFSKLWKGAKEVLRQATYFEMKRRAGTVGRNGLGPAVARLGGIQPGLRVHLIGHSFGARLVSFALAGLPADATGPSSPVKSLSLLQGAFSHFAFASDVAAIDGKDGALAGMANRVDGPLVASFTRLDLAVGKAYPLASMLSRDATSGFEDLLYRWGGVGHDGFQAVDASQTSMGLVEQPYQFAPGRFYNLDANTVIKNGGPPSGSHSDIVHPEIAWALLSAAQVTTGSG